MLCAHDVAEPVGAGDGSVAGEAEGAEAGGAEGGGDEDALGQRGSHKPDDADDPLLAALSQALIPPRS